MGWRSYRQYKIAVTGTALTALAIPEIATMYGNNVQPSARVYAQGCGIVFTFGDNTVAADATAASSILPAGMVQQPDGAIETHKLEQSDAYFSVISDDESATGTVWVDVGHETR